MKMVRDMKRGKSIDLNMYEVSQEIKECYYENMEINSLHLDEFNKFLSFKLIPGLQSLSKELNKTQEVNQNYQLTKDSCCYKYSGSCCKVDWEA